MERKLSDVELKQKQSHPQRERNYPALRNLISKHDDLNSRLRKVEYDLEEKHHKNEKKFVRKEKSSQNSSSHQETPMTPLNTKDAGSKEKFAQTTSILEESITLEETENIPFTPVFNKSFHLPYKTPFNLHKSLSDELPSCSSPILASFSNEYSHCPSIPPKEYAEEILLDESSNATPTHSNEKLLEENDNQSFLAKVPPEHSSS